MSGILLYHRVSCLASDPYALTVSPADFRDQMEQLARTCEPVSLERLRNDAARGALPPKAVAITFDDGYADLLGASDVLVELGLPATFFINSNAGTETYHDTLARVFFESGPLPSDLDMSLLDRQGRLPCATFEDRQAAFKAVGEIGWTLTAEGRDLLVDALQQWAGLDLPPRPSHRVMTEDELRELADRPRHDIGAHTVNHLFMPAQPAEIKRREIADNRHYLQTLLGRPISAFAYPYGAVDDETVVICEDLGFSTAVTVVAARVQPTSHPLLLPRFEVKGDADGGFERLLRDVYH